MHNTKPFLPRIIISKSAIEYSYELERYITIPGTEQRCVYDDIYDCIRWNGINFLRLRNDWYDITTELGDDVTYDDIPSAFQPKKKKQPSYWYNGFGSGKGRRRYFRRPKTTQERRKSFDIDREDRELYGVKIRPSRNATNLPDTWDDIKHARRGDNWKNYRKTQYKPK